MILFFNQVGPFYLSALVPFCLTEHIEEGKFFASNLALQNAWLTAWSISAILRQSGDSVENLRSEVESILSECDILLTSGGAWKGDRDLIVQVLDALGWNLIFHRVRMGPGKALAMGSLAGKPIFCLPGGPPSNEAAFLVIAFPSVLRLAGYTGYPYLRLSGILDKNVGGHKDWTQVIHCRVTKQGSSTHLMPLDSTSRPAPWQKRVVSWSYPRALISFPLARL